METIGAEYTRYALVYVRYRYAVTPTATPGSGHASQILLIVTNKMANTVSANLQNMIFSCFKSFTRKGKNRPVNGWMITTDEDDYQTLRELHAPDRAPSAFRPASCRPD